MAAPMMTETAAAASGVNSIHDDDDDIGGVGLTEGTSTHTSTRLTASLTVPLTKEAAPEDSLEERIQELEATAKHWLPMAGRIDDLLCRVTELEKSTADWRQRDNQPPKKKLAVLNERMQRFEYYLQRCAAAAGVRVCLPIVDVPVPQSIDAHAAVSQPDGSLDSPGIQEALQSSEDDKVLSENGAQVAGGGASAPVAQEREKHALQTDSQDGNLVLRDAKLIKQPTDRSSLFCFLRMGSHGGNFVLREAKLIKQPADRSCLFRSLNLGLCREEDGLPSTPYDGAEELRHELARFIVQHSQLEISGDTLEEWVRRGAVMSCVGYANRLVECGVGGRLEMAVCSLLKKVNVHVYEQIECGEYQRIRCFDNPEARKTVHVLHQGGTHHDALIRPK